MRIYDDREEDRRDDDAAFELDGALDLAEPEPAIMVACAACGARFDRLTAQARTLEDEDAQFVRCPGCGRWQFEDLYTKETDTCPKTRN